MTSVTHVDFRPVPFAEPKKVVSKERGKQPERTFHFWRGASGKRYVHVVHDLFDCPEVPMVNYVLVRVEANGRRTPVRIARTNALHGSQNLAEIRQHAARLGAREVHLNVLAETSHERLVVQWDLQASQFASLIVERAAFEEKCTVGI